MNLIYIYHSCFIIEETGYSVVIDYYKDTDTIKQKGFIYDTLLKQKKKIYVLSSHAHPDHFNSEILQWKSIHPDIQYIFSRDILLSGKVSEKDVFFLDKTECYLDSNLKITAFGSTDMGISFFMEIKDKKIFHAGDLNNWHWKEESTIQESAEAEKNFLEELKQIKEVVHDKIDIVMFPVDPRLGKDYMLGAGQFINYIKTGIFIPMHFGDKYNEANQFASYASSKGVIFKPLSYKGQIINVNEQ